MQQQHDIVKPWNLNKKYTKLLLNCFKESINLRIQYIMDVIGYTNFLRFEIATNMNRTTYIKRTYDMTATKNLIFTHLLFV